MWDWLNKKHLLAASINCWILSFFKDFWALGLVFLWDLLTIFNPNLFWLQLFEYIILDNSSQKMTAERNNHKVHVIIILLFSGLGSFLSVVLDVLLSSFTTVVYRLSSYMSYIYLPCVTWVPVWISALNLGMCWFSFTSWIISIYIML